MRWRAGKKSQYGQQYRVLASLVLELHWCRGDVGGKDQPLQEKVKMKVERWEKIVG